MIRAGQIHTGPRIVPLVTRFGPGNFVGVDFDGITIGIIKRHFVCLVKEWREFVADLTD